MLFGIAIGKTGVVDAGADEVAAEIESAKSGAAGESDAKGAVKTEPTTVVETAKSQESKAKEVVAPKVADVAAATTVPGIPECFPISALDKLEGLGTQGQTFMLDAGTVRGLKLMARRVQDGDESGFEIIFRVTRAALPHLLELMDANKAEKKPLVFHATEVNADGVATFTSTTGKVSSYGSGNVPSKRKNTDAKQYVRAFADGVAGGTIEVVHDMGPLAFAGTVRLSLRGDDASCTKQLNRLVKLFDLDPVFASPVPKSKKRLKLMQALWQVDHAAAKALAANDINDIKIADLEAKLMDAGYTEERIAGLRLVETFDGHFSTYDPVLAQEMVEAGARYLYSTVGKSEHVVSILKGGQKSSVQRYLEGLIFNGMSTNADFNTGGGVGVFSRVVTLDSVYGSGDPKSWTGRTYKLIIDPKVLGRMDWYGWNSDKFGRRWGLDQDTNFGVSLIQSCGQGTSYKSSNELIFTAGQSQSAIVRVVATNENARQKLIKALGEADGFHPPEGVSLEDFVITSSKFIKFGPPLCDPEDLPVFVAHALEAADGGNKVPLTWLLAEGPADSPELGALEERLLLDAKTYSMVIQAAVGRGQFLMDAGAFKRALKKLSKSDESWAQSALKQLSQKCTAALLTANCPAAVDILQSKGLSFHNLKKDEWVKVLRILAAKQTSTGQSPAFKLALETCVTRLLNDNDAGFLAFLEDYPLVQPKAPKGWVTKRVNKLEAGGDDHELALFLAGAKEVSELAWIHMRLIEADCPAAKKLLETSLKKFSELGVDTQTLVKILKKLPDNSVTKNYVLDKLPDILLQRDDLDLMEILEVRWQQRGMTSYPRPLSQEQWQKTVKVLWGEDQDAVSPVLHRLLVHGQSLGYLKQDYLQLLGQMPLFDPNDADSLVSGALADAQAGNPDLVTLAWILTSPEMANHRVAVLEGLLASEQSAVRSLVNTIRSSFSDGRFPLSNEELAQLAGRLADAVAKSGLDNLFKTHAREIILGGNHVLLEKLATVIPNSMGSRSLGLSTGQLQTVLEALGQRKDHEGKALRKWVLANTTKLWLNNFSSFEALFVEQHLKLSDVGQDMEWAVARAQEIFYKDQYHFTSFYYSKQPQYQHLPAAILWMFRDGRKKKLSPEVFPQLQQDAPKWGWSLPVREAFLERLVGKPDDWVKDGPPFVSPPETPSED